MDLYTTVFNYVPGSNELKSHTHFSYLHICLHVCSYMGKQNLIEVRLTHTRR